MKLGQFGHSHSRVVLAFVLATLVGACAPWTLNPAPDQEAPPPEVEPMGVQTSAAQSDATVVRVHFDVLRVDLPIESTRHSLKVWNHLDESQSAPGRVALLARNGIRVGVADGSAWPALRAIFEANNARTVRRQDTVGDGLPRFFELGRVAEGDTYFVHTQRGALEGGTFAAGVKRLRIDYAIKEDAPQTVVVRVTPEFYEDEAQEKWVESGGEVVAVRDHGGVVFDELSATATLQPGQFLVIGGSERANRGLLVGSWWFNSTLDMRGYETLVCITPKVVRIG